MPDEILERRVRYRPAGHPDAYTEPTSNPDRIREDCRKARDYVKAHGGGELEFEERKVGPWQSVKGTQQIAQ